MKALIRHTIIYDNLRLSTIMLYKCQQTKDGLLWVLVVISIATLAYIAIKKKKDNEKSH